MTSKRSPSSRRDRRPRKEQGDKAPRSLDYPKNVEGASDYSLKGIPPKVWERFTTRVLNEGRSRRWVLLRFMEQYGQNEVSL